MKWIREMSVISPPSAKDYLASREHYLIASHKYRLFEKSLREKLGATSDAELEEAFLDPQTRTRFRAEIQAYSELGEAFDSAATNHDLALELQRRRVAQQQAELNSTHYSLDE
jgi:hypothetical protein